MILAYHPEIGVKNSNGTVSIIKMDLPDFQMTEDIMRNLASTFSVKTAGELISKLKMAISTQKYAAAKCQDAVIVSGITDTADPIDVPVFDHDTNII
jgi:hypothetical protein